MDKYYINKIFMRTPAQLLKYKKATLATMNLKKNCKNLLLLLFKLQLQIDYLKFF